MSSDFGTYLVTALAIAAIFVATALLRRRAAAKRDVFDHTGNAMSRMLARAFPEGGTSETAPLLLRLGFRFGRHSGFVPDAPPEDIERLVSAMFPSEEAPRALSILRQYAAGDGIIAPGGHTGLALNRLPALTPGRVHLAALRLAGGNIARLEAEIQRANKFYLPVCEDAESIGEWEGTKRHKAPGVEERSDQVFRDYVLWLCRYLLPGDQLSAGAR